MNGSPPFDRDEPDDSFDADYWFRNVENPVVLFDPLACAECELPADHFVHTCRFTDCRTPHDYHPYVPQPEVFGTRGTAHD